MKTGGVFWTEVREMQKKSPSLAPGVVFVTEVIQRDPNRNGQKLSGKGLGTSTFFLIRSLTGPPGNGVL